MESAHLASRHRRYVVDAVSAVTSSADAPGQAAGNSVANLSSDDFFKLLITQLTSQDPLEPMENEDLLRQISSIREIELSSTLTDSLRTLTGQQRYASASSLIGKHVTSMPNDEDLVTSGTVIGVRFADDGTPILNLSGGDELPLDKVAKIESEQLAAEGLIGKTVIGVDQREPDKPEVVEGRVTSVRMDESGEVLLELDTGQDLRFRDFVSVSSAEA